MAAVQNMAMTTTQKIIAIAVTIIIISTVAIPVIDDMQNLPHSVATNSDVNYNMIKPGEFTNDITLEVVISDSKFMCNGVDLTSLMTGITTPLVFTDSVVIAGRSASTIYFMDGNNNAYDATSVSITFKNDGTWSATYDNGTVNTTSGEFTILLYFGLNGDYGAFTVDSNNPIYLNHGATAYVVGYSWISGGTSNTFVGSTYKDGQFTTIFDRPLSTQSTVTHSFTDHVVDENEYSDRLWFSGTITATNSGTETTVNINSWAVIAPLQYTYVSSEDANLISLIGIIPIMLILVPLMMAVRMMALKRN